MMDFTEEEKYQLIGLQTIHTNLRRQMYEVEKAAEAITEDKRGGHTSDWLWNEEEDIDRLTERLVKDLVKSSTRFHETQTTEKG